MPNTTNFNFPTPADTDLVKDGASAIRSLGNSIDTAFVDLKGGTTGQILSKASNTDLDYTWIANDVGDITNVGVTSPVTGGGSSGSVTIGIDDASTTQKGAVQLEDSTSSTSTTKAATPNSVKSAYDLANGAIAKSLVDAKGDLIVGTADNTVARLASSASNGNVLTVDTSTASGLKWAAPSSGALTLISRTTWSSASSHTVDNVFTSTYTSYLIVIEDWISSGFANLPQIQLRYGSTTEASGYYGSSIGTTFNSGTLVFEGTDNAAAFDFWRYSGEAFGTFITAYIERVGTGSNKDAAITGQGIVNTNAEQYKFGMRTTIERNYTGFLLKQSGGTSSGVVTVYGLAKA